MSSHNPIKILAGFRTDNPEVFLRSFADGMSENNIEIDSMEMKFSKIAIKQFLNEHQDTDVLIVMEYLEESKPFQTADFTEIKEKYEALNIIPIISGNKKGSQYMHELLNIGVFNAVYDGDATYDNISMLIKQTRTRKEARIYYGATDELAESVGADIEQCRRHIMSAKNTEELKNNALYIKNAVTERELIIILQGIDDERKELLKQYEEISPYIGGVEKVTNHSEATPKARGPLISINRPAKKEVVEKVVEKVVVEKVVVEKKVDLSKVILNTTVGFAGIARRVGNTHQALSAANYLANHDYKVAVVEIIGKSESDLKQLKKSVEIEEETDKGFRVAGVDYYPNFSVDMISELITGEYNFIIVDFGVYEQSVRAELDRCTVQVVTGSYGLWEREAVEQFIEQRIAGNMGINYNYLLQNVPNEVRLDIKEEYKDRAKVYFTEVGVPLSGDGNSGIEQIFVSYVSEKNEKQDEKKKGLLSFLHLDTRTKNRPAVKPKEKVRDNHKDRRKDEKDLREDNLGTLKKNRKAELRGTGVAFVTSLKQGVGCTHYSIASSNYLEDEDMGKICLISNRDAAASIKENLNKSVECVLKNADIDDLYWSYDYLIIDKGPLRTLEESDLRELRRADYKIMICKADDDYLSALAGFIRSMKEQAKGWYFIFNTLPKSKEKEIERLMVGYKTFFLPLFEANNLPGSVRKSVFREIY